MTMQGVRLIPMGLMVLSAAMANAQAKLVPAADETPAPSAPAAAPVYPKRPAELPPTLPIVTCKGDQLTISANNATLEAILAGVKGCTGAKIDIPEGASRVRAFEDLGPGPVREVLDELLSGTRYNYVIQSSEANPLKVETVLLSMRVSDTDKPGSDSTDTPVTTGRKLWQHMQKFDKPDPSMLNEDGTMIEADPNAASDSAEAAPGPAVPNAAQPSANAGEPAAAEAAASTPPAPPTPIAPPVVDPGSNADPSKAIQDRISAMQQMFNQRQQMVQKQNQGPSGSPNN